MQPIRARVCIAASACARYSVRSAARLQWSCTHSGPLPVRDSPVLNQIRDELVCVLVVAAALQFLALPAVNTIRNAAVRQLRLDGAYCIDDGLPDGSRLFGCLSAESFPADGYKRLSVCPEGVIDKCTLWKLGAVNSSPVSALSGYKVLNSDPVTDQVHDDEVGHIGNSHGQFQQADRGVLRQQNLAFPFGVRILSRLSSDCVHGGVFDGLPVVCIIDDLNSQLNSLPVSVMVVVMVMVMV